MTTEHMQDLVAAATHAFNVFTKLDKETAATFMATPGGAVVIDCLSSGQRLMLVASEPHPKIVCVAIGAKNSGEYLTLGHVPIGDVTSQYLLDVMEQHFAFSGP